MVIWRKSYMSIEHIKLSQQAKEQLSRMKTWSKIQHWNVLCRWAFCLSLAEPGRPPETRIQTDSNVEIPWKVFGGAYADIYLALLKQRCAKDGLGTSSEVLAEQLKLHIHRGIGYLAAERNNRSVADLLKRVSV